MSRSQPVNLGYTTYEPVSGADKNLAPIIYLHGVTDYRGTWEEIPQIVANATKRISYNLDSRNHGHSDQSDEFNFDINVIDLIHLMDNLEIKKAILVGHSMGGITAIKTALKRPERVEKIVAEDMFVRKVPQHIIDMVLTYIKLMKEAIRKTPKELSENDAKKFILKHINSNLPEEAKSLTAEGNDDDIEVNTCFVDIYRDTNGRYQYTCNLDAIEKSHQNAETIATEPEGQFKGPACFIYGKNSPMQVGADEDHIRRFFPNAVFEGVDDVGHNVHNDKPQEFTQILLKFLS